MALYVPQAAGVMIDSDYLSSPATITSTTTGVVGADVGASVTVPAGTGPFYVYVNVAALYNATANTNAVLRILDASDNQIAAAANGTVSAANEIKPGPLAESDVISANVSDRIYRVTLATGAGGTATIAVPLTLKAIAC